MKFGVYNAILHDRPLPEAIKVIAGLGLTGIELNSGGFLPPVHIPAFDDILSSDAARDDFLGLFEGTGVDMSGLPAGEPGGRRPNWIVNAWNSGALDVLDYQWSVAEQFWREVDREAADLDVKVALELHPQNLVFNPAGIRELVERTNEWPKDAAWDFVALGRGHDAVYWSTWLAALHVVDPDMRVNIEHEDTSLGPTEGLEEAAKVLLDAARRAGIPTSGTR